MKTLLNVGTLCAGRYHVKLQCYRHTEQRTTDIYIYIGSMPMQEGQLDTHNNLCIHSQSGTVDRENFAVKIILWPRPTAKI